MPLLGLSKEIEVVTVREPSKGDLQGKHLVQHFERHGLNVELEHRDDEDIPEAIFKETAAWRASLLVMGGYGHSRLRKFVLGGMTRTHARKNANPDLNGALASNPAGWAWPMVAHAICGEWPMWRCPRAAQETPTRRAAPRTAV